MNRFEVTKELRTVGISLRYNSNFREYRVNFRTGAESSAYYTDDLEDARDTGLAMASRAERIRKDFATLFPHVQADIMSALSQ